MEWIGFCLLPNKFCNSGGQFFQNAKYCIMNAKQFISFGWKKKGGNDLIFD